MGVSAAGTQEPEERDSDAAARRARRQTSHQERRKRGAKEPALTCAARCGALAEPSRGLLAAARTPARVGPPPTPPLWASPRPSPAPGHHHAPATPLHATPRPRALLTVSGTRGLARRRRDAVSVCPVPEASLRSPGVLQGPEIPGSQRGEGDRGGARDNPPTLAPRLASLPGTLDGFLKSVKWANRGCPPHTLPVRPGVHGQPPRLSV